MGVHPDLKDRPMWEAMADALGARLHGWSYDYSATFIFPKGEVLQIHREGRDAINRLIAATPLKEGE